MIHKICGEKQGALSSISKISLKSQRFPTFLTSGPLADKQQKMGEHVDNIECSLDALLNFIFSTCSHVFCCFCARGPDVSRFLYIFGDPRLLYGVQLRSFKWLLGRLLRILFAVI